MRLNTALVLAVAQGVYSFQLLKEKANPAVLDVNVQRHRWKEPSSKLTPQLNQFFYAFDLTIGTPPQSVSAIFDTGSRDFNINVVNSTLCQQGGCTQNGAYDPTKSSTERWVADDLQVQYLLGSANGSWVKDNLKIGGAAIPSFQFGIQNYSANPQSYWGSGFPEEKETVSGPNGPPLTSLRALKAKGVIKSASESVRLANPPSIIFGGADTSQFEGLVQLPIIKSDGSASSLGPKGTYDRVAIQSNSVNGQATNFRMLVDTGNFDIKLPKSIVQPIWDKYQISPFDVGGVSYGVCQCSLNTTKDTIDFKFGKFAQKVPMTTLVYDPAPELLAAFGAQPLPQGYCIFGINPWDSAQTGIDYILGGAFLRNVYTIINEDTHEVGLAHLKAKPGKPCVQEIA